MPQRLHFATGDRIHHTRILAREPAIFNRYTTMDVGRPFEREAGLIAVPRYESRESTCAVTMAVEKACRKLPWCGRPVIHRHDRV